VSGTCIGVRATIVTVSGALSTVPSFTTRLSTYEPARSAVKVGAAAVALDSVAVLPSGLDVSDHRYVSGSPFASVLPVPSTATSAPVVALWSRPALATGATFAGEERTHLTMLLDDLSSGKRSPL
jgi:hypothetical protein